MESDGTRGGDGKLDGKTLSSAMDAGSSGHARTDFGPESERSESTTGAASRITSPHVTAPHVMSSHVSSSHVTASHVMSLTSSPHTPIMSTDAAALSRPSGPSTEAPSPWSGAKSFADAVAPRVNPSHVQTSTPRMSQSEVHRTQRTFIVRRAPPDFTPQHVIRTLADQFAVPATHLFESVLRDPHDRRRLYLTFKSHKVKQQVLEKGFSLGDIVIKPSDGSISGYIPFPPFYIDTSTIVTALSKHGHVISHSFVSTSDGIRIAGFKFALKLFQNAVAPREIRYGDALMAVRYDDDLRRCAYCNAYGHTIRFCRKRLAAAAGKSNENQNVPDTSDVAMDTEDSADGVPVAAPPAAAKTDGTAPARLAALWRTAQDALCREEEVQIKELLFHHYCRSTTLHDVAEEYIADHFDEVEDEDAVRDLREIVSRIEREIVADWRREWSAIRERSHTLREEDHAAFRSRGLPPETPVHPPGYEALKPPRCPDYTSCYATPAEDVFSYVSNFGFDSEYRKLVSDAVDELYTSDSAMEEDTGHADDESTPEGDTVAPAHIVDAPPASPVADATPPAPPAAAAAVSAPSPAELPTRPTSFAGPEKLTAYASYITFNSASGPKYVKACIKQGLSKLSRYPGYDVIKPNHFLLRCHSATDGTKRYLLFLPTHDGAKLFHNQLDMLMDAEGHPVHNIDPRVSPNPHFDSDADKDGVAVSSAAAVVAASAPVTVPAAARSDAPAPLSFADPEPLGYFKSYFSFTSSIPQKTLLSVVTDGLTEISTQPGCQFVKPTFFAIRWTSHVAGSRTYYFFVPEFCSQVVYDKMPPIIRAAGHAASDVQPLQTNTLYDGFGDFYSFMNRFIVGEVPRDPDPHMGPAFDT